MLPLIIDVCIYGILIWVFLTQLAMPLIRGTKPFPFFRRDSRKVADAIQDATSDLELARLENEAKKIREQVNQTKSTK